MDAKRYHNLNVANKIPNRITPTLPSPLGGGGLGWGAKGTGGEVP